MTQQASVNATPSPTAHDCPAAANAFGVDSMRPLPCASNIGSQTTTSNSSGVTTQLNVPCGSTVGSQTTTSSSSGVTTQLTVPCGSTAGSKYFPPSELIINDDGSVFHLHIRPEQLAPKVILVGDPGRVETVAQHFDTRECDISSREFHTITGTYQGKRITVLSTGIGCDNIDIVMNELDALANIDFQTRTEKPQLTSLEICRIGTCGGLQPNTPVGTFVCSEISIGFDGLLNFYAGRNAVCDLPFERAFINHMGWTGNLCQPHPYVIHADEEMVNRIAREDMVRGITIACGGFFGPQGRQLRLPLADPNQNTKIESFTYPRQHTAPNSQRPILNSQHPILDSQRPAPNSQRPVLGGNVAEPISEYRITNFEMESSALAGLSRLMGHRATTVCMVIANRLACEANTSYKNTIDTLITTVLDRI